MQTLTLTLKLWDRDREVALPPGTSWGDAAQEAEHRHAETGRPHTVTEEPSGEVAYVSKGAPE